MATYSRSLIGMDSTAGASAYGARPLATPTPAPVVDLVALQAASSALQEQLGKDEQAVPDLGEMLTIAGRPSSGTYSTVYNDHRVPLYMRKIIPIPEDVFRFGQTTHQNWSMGILPEIERVWFAIDQQLVLWDYVEGQALDTYAEQPDIITHVALVRPKPGVFIDDIHHLLVVCTPVSVILLGIQEVAAVGPNGRPRKELRVYATNMSVATEVEMTSVIGMKDGRVFMAGLGDGNLYELHYQEKESWFSKKVQLINHSVGGVQSLLPKFSTPTASDKIISLLADHERNCFYALTERSIIHIYRANGEKTVQLHQTLHSIYKSAQDRAPGSPALAPSSFRIFSLHTVSPHESRAGVQLLAITTNGVRLYFAPIASGYSYYNASGGGAGQLQLLHVRLPPSDLRQPEGPLSSYGPSSNGGQPITVHDLEYTVYDAGVTLTVQPGENDAADFMLGLAPDLTRIGTLGQTKQTPVEAPMFVPATSGPQRPPLVEYAYVHATSGRTTDVRAVPRPTAGAAGPAPHELAAQFSEPARQFLALTTTGVSLIAKRRPLDQLIDVLEGFQKDGDAHTLLDIRDSFGRDETCAMLLGLASGSTFLDLNATAPTSTATSFNPSLAKQLFYDVGERPTWTERTTYGSTDTTGITKFSGRRQGFALYFARLVRPIWKSRITKQGPIGIAQLNVSEGELEIIQKNLFALKAFLDGNPQLFHSAPGDHNGARSAGAPEQDAWRNEQTSVTQLQTLLSRTVEAISFILLLNDYKIGELIAQCDADVQKAIASLTFEDLITAQTGVTSSRALVNVVIDQQIGQQIGVDTVSEILQSRCGSFCSTDDVMLYKAKENIRRAVETRLPQQRLEWLGESLRLFVKGARILDLEKLREIVGDYQHLEFAKGAVELPLHIAQVVDPDNQGRAFWHEGCPAPDPRSSVWEQRRQCYDLVLDSLSVFDGQSSKLGAAEDASATRDHAYELALSSDDEMFHSTLYDWLIQRGLADELIEMRPPYLEAHLRREPVTVQKYQLLWQFYVKDGQPLRAAEILGTLADSAQFDLPLNSRLEYLTLAVGNAKSHPVSAGGRHETALAYLTELEEKLEVAQVQLEIYNTLLPRVNEEGEVGRLIRDLQTRLFSITELFQYYAEPFDLPAIKLLILHVSEHRDETLARTIWNQIFEEAIENVEGETAADRIVARVTPLGQRFYPSESAFPLRHVAGLLVRFALANKGAVPHGWAPRILVQCGVPPAAIWELFNEMYESQIPPFNEQANVQAVSSDIAVLLADWTEEAMRPQSAAAREYPVARIDRAIDQYLAELEPSRTETRAAYDSVKRRLRAYW